MNERQLTRNTGRIPALLEHIARAKEKKQPKRAANFKHEFDRRVLEIELAEKKGQITPKQVAKIHSAITAKKAELAKAARAK